MNVKIANDGLFAKVLAFVGAVACGLGAFAAADDLYFEHVTAREGLSQNSVNAILQDVHGYLWIGTQDGLNRYDGYNFTVYRPLPGDGATSAQVAQSGLTHGLIEVLHEDRQNELWVGTSSGLNRFHRETETFVHYRHLPDDQTSLSDRYVRAIADDGQGNLWVGTARGGLNLLDRETGTFTHFRHDPSDPQSISSDRVTAIAEVDGMLWIGTEDAGINHFDPASGNFTRYRHDPQSGQSLSSDEVAYLLLDSHKVLWIATIDEGLNRYDSVTGVFVHYQHDANNPDSISSNAIRTLYEDSAGSLWVGHFNTFGGGVGPF